MISTEASESPNSTYLKLTHVLEVIICLSQYLPLFSSRVLLIRSYMEFTSFVLNQLLQEGHFFNNSKICCIHKSIVQLGDLAKDD